MYGLYKSGEQVNLVNGAPFNSIGSSNFSDNRKEFVSDNTSAAWAYMPDTIRGWDATIMSVGSIADNITNANRVWAGFGNFPGSGSGGENGQYLSPYEDDLILRHWRGALTNEWFNARFSVEDKLYVVFMQQHSYNSRYAWVNGEKSAELTLDLLSLWGSDENATYAKSIQVAGLYKDSAPNDLQDPLVSGDTIRLAAVWNRALLDSEILSLSRDPYQLLRPATPSLYIIPRPVTLTAGSPNITNVTPSTVANGSTNVVVTGTNFGATQGSSTLDIAGVIQTGLTWSDTSITIPTVDLTGVPNGSAYVRVDVN